MKKLTTAPLTLFKMMLFLIISLFIVYGFIRGSTEAIYGKCWNEAIAGFSNLKDGENKITLDECINKVYIVRKTLDTKTNKLTIPDTVKDLTDVYRCGNDKLTSDEYQAFVVIHPKKGMKVTDVAQGLTKVLQTTLEPQCVSYPYIFNRITLKGKDEIPPVTILDGKNIYCVIMEAVRATGTAANPEVDKNLILKEGGC